MATPGAKIGAFWKVLFPVFFLIFLITGGLYFIKLYVPGSSRENPEVEIRVGSSLPNFTLTRIDGSRVQVSDLKGKVFLINFWATWCDACMEEMPSIVKLHQIFSSKGFEVLGINLDENPEARVPQAVRDLHLDFPLFKDPDGKTAELFDVHAIPLTVIIDRNRNILFLKDGGLDWSAPSIQAELNRWLSG